MSWCEVCLPVGFSCSHKHLTLATAYAIQFAFPSISEQTNEADLFHAQMNSRMKCFRSNAENYLNFVGCECVWQSTEEWMTERNIVNEWRNMTTEWTTADALKRAHTFCVCQPFLFFIHYTVADSCYLLVITIFLLSPVSSFCLLFHFFVDFRISRWLSYLSSIIGTDSVQNTSDFQSKKTKKRFKSCVIENDHLIARLTHAANELFFRNFVKFYCKKKGNFNVNRIASERKSMSINTKNNKSMILIALGVCLYAQNEMTLATAPNRQRQRHRRPSFP